MFEAIHCCYLIYLRALELCALKYINYFFSAPGLACQVAFKKTKVKSDLLTDIDMLSVYHSIYQYEKSNNKYMKDFDNIKNLHMFNLVM